MTTTSTELSILGRFRILLSLMFLFSFEVKSIGNLNIITDTGQPIFGIDWLISNVGTDIIWSQISQYLVWIGATLALVGYLTRFGLLLMLLGSGYIFGLLQYHSFPVHIHHLWWFAFLLLFTPCDERLSLKHRLKNENNGISHAPNLWFLEACLGFIFFFPGWHKLLSEAFRSGEILQNMILWKQAQYWNQQLLNLNFPDWFFMMGSWFAIIFELSAILLLLRKHYLLFITLALSFHLGTWLLMGIEFSNLWPLYFAFLVFPSSKSEDNETFTKPTWYHFTPVYLFLLGLVWAGFTNLQKGFPLISYPSFTQKIASDMPLLAIHLIDENNEITIVPYQEYIAPNNQAWGENWRLAGLGYPISPQKLEAYWYKHEKDISQPSALKRIEFHLSMLDTNDPTLPSTSKRTLHGIQFPPK